MADVTNPLFDGNLSVTVGGHNFTPYLLPGLSWSNTNPGGFGDATFRIASSSPASAFAALGHTMAKGDAVVITHSAQTLFEGEITNDVSHATIEDGFAFYDVTAAGLWWRAGQKKDYCTVWADDDPGQWFERETRGGVFQVDTEGKLDIRLEAGQTAKNGATKSLYYWLDSGLGDTSAHIHQLFCLVAANVSDKDTAQWHADISSSDSPWGTWTVEQSWANETVSAGTPVVVTMSAGTRAIRLRLYVNNAASSGTTADRYIKLTKASVGSDRIEFYAIGAVATGNPAVITSAHNLKTGDRIFIGGTTTSGSINGWQTVTYVNSSSFSVPVNVTSVSDGVGVYARAPLVDEAMQSAARDTNLAASSSLQTGGIGNASWGLNIRPHMSRAEAIEYLAGTHSAPIDYGFWDTATFYCKERATPATCTYTIDATDPGIDFDVYKDREVAPDYVKVLYLFRDVDGGTSVYPDGTLRAVYRSSAPTWTDAAVAVEVWEDWADMVLTEAQAQNIGDQILAWYDANAYAGTITIAAPTVTLGAGGTRNAAYIRASEWVLESNLNVKLPITGVDVDADSGTVTLSIGENRNDFVARIVAASGGRPDRGRGPAGPSRPRIRRRR